MGRAFHPARFFARALSRALAPRSIHSALLLRAPLPCPLVPSRPCTRDERAKAGMTARGRGSIAVVFAWIVPSVPWGGSESMACPNGDGKKSRGGPHSLLGARRRSLTRHLHDSVVDAASGQDTAATIETRSAGRALGPAHTALRADQ